MSHALAGKDGEREIFIFAISGVRFDRMPLSRVSRYMAQLSKLAGKGAVFHSMTSTEIRFVDAGSPAPSEDRET